ncbi:MAG: hypothetical protein KatS3mg110_0786 [Pirellulaceae bacterium]|nr:MAG: hypothetical protein KatS3mg110_0786 [Pirellulaceae bacterium]
MLRNSIHRGLVMRERHTTNTAGRGCAAWWAAAVALLAFLPPAVADEPADPAALVRMLADPEFTVREQASQALVGLGREALEAVVAGTRHPDREIRYRCRRILSLIQRNDFERRLALFVADPTGQHDYGLPGWQVFRAEFGSSSAARQFYVEMLRAEPALFEALQQGAAAAAEQLENRTWQLQQQPLELTGQTPPVASLAAFLFLLMQPDLEVSDAAANYVLNHCFQGYFEKALYEGPARALVRQLLGKVVERADEWPAYTAIRLALRYDLPEGLQPALRILQEDAQATVVYLRQYAVLAVGRFGDARHTEVLEKLLDDATPCIPAQAVNQQTFETQLRDVALAVLWKLHGEDPRQHGFSNRVQEDPQLGFHPSTLGFNSAEERKAALEQWRAFRAQSRRETKP